MEKTPLVKKEGTVPGTKLNILNLLVNIVVVCVLATAANMYGSVMSQYVYHRVADSVFGNDTRIKNFSVLAPCFQNTSDEGYRLVEEAQKITSTKLFHFSSVSAAIGVFSNIILGSYSDIIGRKFLFLCPMAGYLFRNGITAIIIYWHLDLRFFYLATGLNGLLGGGWAIMLASMTHAADNTPPEQSRSLSIVIIECVIGLSESIASTATGYFIQNTGFFYPSLTSAVLTLFDIVLVVIFIKKTGTEESPRETSLFSGLRNFKDIYLGGSTLNRSIFWIGLVSFFFATMNFPGGSNIETLFFMNLPFCWSPEKLGIYDTISTVVRKTLGVGIVRILQCCCSDTVMGILGSISDIGGELLTSFATTDWMVYLGFPVVAIIGFIPIPMARGILSKQVPYNRQGAIFASMSVLEAVGSVLASVTFNNIYRATVTFWRGAVYTAYACVDVLTLASFVVLMVLLRKQREPHNLTKKIQETD